ncbi:exo-beta-N-acetylmuramidase NamZ family protein [Desulforhopalus sp. 52FAK]
MIRVGLEVLLDSSDYAFEGRKIAYLSNQASTTSSLVQGRIPLQQKYGEQLTCLFSPQHGFFSEKQDNMIESDHSVDAQTGLPMFSLYGDLRKPTKEMYDSFDVLLIDLVDVGTRVYTFMYTMAYCMMTAAETGRKVVILDRPNPIGGTHIEGNILRDDCTSFVGLYPLPMRHGLTMGELAFLMNREFNIGADLSVIPVKGWARESLSRETGFPWVAPSPNMPTPECALVYPGQVIWEGTNVSEGRGTTQPFEFVGAPFWKHNEVFEYLGKTELPGCFLRPVVFEPTSGKWAESACCGFQVHVTNSDTFMPYRTSLALLQAVYVLYPEDFQYKEPPYEYEYKRLPMDLIIGDKDIRIRLEAGESIIDLENEWSGPLKEFDTLRSDYFLY